MSANPYGGFPEKGGTAASRGSFWWNARATVKKQSSDRADPDDKNEELAAWLTDVAKKLENAHLHDRWRSLVFYRHFTGRPTSSQFSYGMAKRPSSFHQWHSAMQFQPPRYNVIAECGDVYVNRLLSQQIYLAVVSERGDFKMRQLSKMLEMWVEAGLEETGFWRSFARMGLDALCYGSGIVKPCIGLNDKIAFPRVHRDELLFENEDEDEQNTAIQRVWANREDILDRYGTSPARIKAIEAAPSAYPAFYQGDLDCRNVIPLVEGWRLPHVNGKAGRRALVIGNLTLADEEYTDPELPFEKFDFHMLPSGTFGQGLAEILLTLNEEIDFVMGANSEAVHRVGFPKWLREMNSGVNPDALGDTIGAVVDYQGVKPEMITPPPTHPENFAYAKDLIALARTRAHISEIAVKGESGGGAGASAVALEKRSQIDDANFKEMGQRLERFTVGCAYKMIRLGAKAKPSFTLPGRSRQLIDWGEVSDAIGRALKKPIGFTAFGMSRFPQSISGRQELLDSMLANGTISRRWHTRFSQVPDVDGMLDLLNAPQEAVDRALDMLLAKDGYTPPSQFMDLDYAKQQVEARYLLEQNEGTPQQKLDQFLMWRAAVLEMLEERNTPDKPPGDAVIPPPGGGAPVPASFGDQQSGNPALAPPPPQIPPMLPPVGAPAAAPPGAPPL